MNIKKVGLTALAGSLVAASAYAGEMSVAGSASLNVEHTNGGASSSGKTFSMGNQLTFSGSGELDNGLTVSLSFVLDQNDDSTTANGATKNDDAGTPFDSHSVSISSDALGTLKFSGEGGSSASTALDTTAAGDIWDNGSGFYAAGSSPLYGESGDNSMMYTLPSFIDGATIKASYSPGGAGGPSATSYAIGYTGVEGLSLDYGVGEIATVGNEADITTMKASYAYSSFTLSYSNTEAEHDLSSNTDEEISSWNLAYTVSDDLSIAYGVETIETEGQANDEEGEKFNVSYTTGGVTISATQYNFENIGGTAGAAGEKERWALSATFAF